jgi:hypothetical protein
MPSIHADSIGEFRRNKMRERRVTKAVRDLKKSLEIAPREISQTRRQLLEASGMTAGAIERLSKGIEPEVFKFTYEHGLQRCNKNDTKQTALKHIKKLAKAYGGYRSLVKTMLGKGMDKAKIIEMLKLTDAEFEDFRRN